MTLLSSFTTVSSSFSPPLIKAGPQTIFARLYQAVTLTCIATGSPQPTIAWYKDGSEIPEEGSPFLVIEEVELSDRGVYWCTAVNTEGNTFSMFAYINIEGKDLWWHINCTYQT